MKIVNSEIALEAAIERRYMERLRERVRSRVELEARLMHSAQNAHREYSSGEPAFQHSSGEPAFHHSSGEPAFHHRNEAGRVTEVFNDSFEEQQVQREIESRVDARLKAMAAYNAVDIQSPAAVGERLARGELRYEPETEARERFRAMARQNSRNVEPARLWSLDRDRYLEVDTGAHTRVKDEDSVATDPALAGESLADQQTQEHEDAEMLAQIDGGKDEAHVGLVANAVQDLRSGNIAQRDGQEISTSRRERLLSAGGEDPLATAVDNLTSAMDRREIAAALADGSKSGRPSIHATGSQVMLWQRAQQAYRQWH